MSLIKAVNCSNIPEFNHALTEGHAFFWGKRCYAVNPILGRVLEYIPTYNQRRYASATKVFTEHLSQQAVKTYTPEKESELKTFYHHLKSKNFHHFSNKKADKSLFMQWAAYQRRADNSGNLTCFTDDVHATVYEAATVWMTKHLSQAVRPGDPNIPDYVLTQEDKERLSELFRSSEYTLHFAESSKFADFYFEWTLVHKLDPRILLEFPDVAKKLRKNIITLHAARVGGDALVYRRNDPAAVNEETPYRSISLKVCGKEESLTDKPSKILEEVFACFSKKHIRQGKFQIFQDKGVVGWKSLELAYYDPVTKKLDPIDVTQDGWEKKLPVFETISADALYARYGVRPEPGESVFLLAASKNSFDFDVLGLHGYFLRAIPTEDGKNYTIETWGLYPRKWPHAPEWLAKAFGWIGKIIGKIISVIKQLGYLTSTVTSSVANVDESEMLYHRLHAYYPISLTPEQKEKSTKIIAKDIEIIRQGGLPFSLSGDNCFNWALSVLVRVFDDKYEVNGTDIRDLFTLEITKAATSTPQGRVVGLFASIKNPKVRSIVFTITHLLLGSWRQYSFKVDGQQFCQSLRNHPRFKDQKMIHPGEMMHQIKSNLLPNVGVVHIGPATAR